MNLILISLVVALFFIVFWTILIVTKKPDVQIVIKQQTNAGTREINSTGKYIKEGTPLVEKIKLKNGDKIPLWRDYFSFDEKGRAKLKIFQDSDGDYFPIKVQYNAETGEIEEKTDSKNMKFWFANETRARIEAFKKQNIFLDKVLPAIIWIVICIMFIMSLHYSNENLKATAGQIGGIVSRDEAIRSAEINASQDMRIAITELSEILEELGVKRQNARIVN